MPAQRCRLPGVPGLERFGNGGSGFANYLMRYPGASTLGTGHADGRGHRPKGWRRENDTGAASRRRGRQGRPGGHRRHGSAIERRAMGGRPRGRQPAVVYCPPPRLAVTLQTARRNGAHVAFIDTAPAVESPALAAVRAADFCLIVSRPGILDLRSIGINVEIAKLAGKPVALVINAAPGARRASGRGRRGRPRAIWRGDLPDHRPAARGFRACPGRKPVRAGGRARRQGRNRGRGPVGLARSTGRTSRF